MNENDVGQVSNLPDVGQVSNLSSDGPVENLSHQPQAPSPSESQQSQPPAAEQQEQVAGQVENLSHQERQVENLPHEEQLVENLPHVLDRIRSHPELPRGMRERLVELVQRQPPAEGPPQIPLDDVLAIFAETVPSQLRLDAGELPTAPHPEGESFFTGDPAADADRHATDVAREQLALSGLLRR